MQEICSTFCQIKSKKCIKFLFFNGYRNYYQ
nr:MAG TPA: hypothetical protein [Caudoviricetes sp.]